MKNQMVVPVLVLVLLVSFVGSSFASIQPYDYKDVTRPDGDDHPWGGEQFNQDVVPLKSYSQRFPTITALGAVDFLFGVYMDLFLPHQSEITKSNPTIKQADIKAEPISSEINNEPSVVNRGF